ncbi:MAG: hypothetical protein JOZ69_21255 [Myxococcales bacterium]|nr:hypothetical protein [Myxococcales bacterium]
MRIGGKYRLREIGLRQWAKFATELKLPPERVAEHVHRIAGALPDLASDVLDRTEREGLSHPIVRRLAAAVSRRARECAVAA